ncbi:MAG: hypothetical protein ACOYNS_03740 [Bacteroidota bacterium]
MINTFLMLRSSHISAVILTAVLLFFDIASAQFEQPGGSRSIFAGASGVTLGAVAQSWTIKDSGTISQQSAPFSLSVPLSNRMLMSVTNSGASTSFGSEKVTGIVDTRVSLSYVFPGDKIWLTGGLSVPTGKTKLTSPQLSLMSLVSQTAFAYRVPTFGQGLSGNIAVVYAGSITRRMVLGVGLSYFYKGKYEPVEATSTFNYDAGDELSANLGYDFITFSKVARLSLDMTATYFLDDKLNGKTVFRSGPRFIGLIAYSLKSGSMNHLLQLRSRYRLPNTFFNGTTETKYDATLQLEGQYSLSYPAAEWLQSSGVIEIKNFSSDQVPVGGVPVETGKAQIISAGADGTFLFSTIVYPTISLRYATGTVVMENHSKDVHGIEAGLLVRVVF